MLKHLAGVVLLGHGLGHAIGPIASFDVKIKGMAERPYRLLPGKQAMTDRLGKAWSVIWIVAILPFVMSGIGTSIGEPG